MKYKLFTTLLAIFLFTIATSFQLLAQNKVVSSDQGDIIITMYNEQYATVSDKRSLNLERGHNLVEVHGVPAFLESADLHVFLDGNHIETIQGGVYHGMDRMIRNLIGHEVGLTGSDGTEITGRAIEYNDSILVIQKENNERVLVPGIYNYRIRILSDAINLCGSAGLNLTIDANNSGNQELVLMYVTRNFGWKAEHQVRFTDDTTVTWEAFSVISNQSGGYYDNSTLRLYSGDIQLNAQHQFRGGLRAEGLALAAAFDAADIQQDGFSGHYLYTYPRKVDIKTDETRRILLHRFEDVNADRRYEYFSSSRAGTIRDARPDLILYIDTDDFEYNLPAGQVRFLSDSTPEVRVLGEGSTGFITRGDESRFRLGRVSDLAVTETVTRQQSERNRFQETDHEIEIRNNRDKAQTLHLFRNIGNNGEIRNPSIEPEMRDARTALFIVEIPANSSAKVTFTQYNRMQ